MYRCQIQTDNRLITYSYVQSIRHEQEGWKIIATGPASEYQHSYYRWLYMTYTYAYEIASWSPSIVLFIGVEKLHEWFYLFFLFHIACSHVKSSIRMDKWHFFIGLLQCPYHLIWLWITKYVYTSMSTDPFKKIRTVTKINIDYITNQIFKLYFQSLPSTSFLRPIAFQLYAQSMSLNMLFRMMYKIYVQLQKHK